MGGKGLVWIVLDECYLRVLHTFCGRGADVVKGLCKINVLWFEGDAAGIFRREGQQVVDQAHQHVAVVHDHTDNLLLLFLCLQHGKHVRESHDRVEGRTDLMRHVGHEGTLHHTRLVSAFRFLLQLFLFSHEWCYVTDYAKALHKLSVLIEMRQTVEHVPLWIFGVVENRPCIAEVCHGLGEVNFRLAETLCYHVVLEEIGSQIFETHHLLGVGEFLVECNFAFDSVSAPESHVTLLHQILQLVLILLYLLVLLTDEGFVLTVLYKEVALLGQIADRDGDIQQLSLFVMDCVQHDLGITVDASLRYHGLGAEGGICECLLVEMFAEEGHVVDHIVVIEWIALRLELQDLTCLLIDVQQSTVFVEEGQTHDGLFIDITVSVGEF